MNINTPGLYSKIKEEGKPVTKPAEPITLADNIKNKLIPDRAKGAAREAFTRPVTNPERGVDKPVPKPIEQSQFSRIPRVLKTALYARNTGIKDNDGNSYINTEDAELLNKLGFSVNPNEYSFLAIGDKVEDTYSYIEKVAGISKGVVEAIDKDQAFSAEFLKELDYKVPDGYEVKGDLVVPLEKEAGERVRVVLPYKDQYLLEKLMNSKWPDNYGKRRFPGGGIGLNETPAQAASREFMEELGINVAPDKFEYMGLDPDSKQHYLKLVEHGLNPGKYKANVGSDPYIYLEQGLPEGLDYLGADISKFNKPIEKKAAVDNFKVKTAEDNYTLYRGTKEPLAPPDSSYYELLRRALQGELKNRKEQKMLQELARRQRGFFTPDKTLAENYAGTDGHLYSLDLKDSDLSKIYGDYNNLGKANQALVLNVPHELADRARLVEKKAAADPSQTILITGHSGAGKSTLGKLLAEKLNLPLHRVDAHPEFKEYVTKDNEHWKDSLTPGTQEYKHYTDLVNRANRDTLKASDSASIIEGAQLGHLSPEELAKYKAHILVGGDVEQSIAQRIQRAIDKAAKKGITFSPEEIELRKAKSKLVADYWEPGMEKFKQLPGVLRYNHTEDKPELLIDTLRELMSKKAAADHPLTSSNIKAVGYDKKEKTMEVEFHSGGTYKYNDVPKSLFDRIKRVKSPGKFFHKHIRRKDKFPFSKLEKESAEKIAPPLPHQRKAVEKLLNQDQEGLILMHGLGSGKTRTSIEAYKALGLPAEVIVPAALKGNYEKEIEKWVGKLPKDIAIKSQQEIARKGLSSDLKNKLMIIDEAHRIRNPGNKLLESVRTASPAKRLLLTGTPIYNHPSDLSAIINTASGKDLLPEERKAFEEKYIEYKNMPQSFIHKLMMLKPEQKAALRNAPKLKKILNKYIDYYPGSSEGFPEVKEEQVHVPMSENQVNVYKALMKEVPWVLRKKIELGLHPSKQELDKLIPFLTGARMISNTSAGFEKNPTLVRSPKLEQAVNYLKDKINKDPEYKALVYSNYLGSGVEPYKDYLNKSKIPYGEFTGEIKDSVRNQLIQDYNNNKLKALLVSSAGAEGLDLKGTRLVQILEPHFNNEKIKQVIGRAARYKSHEALSPDKRNVLVQKYLSSVPKSFWQKITGDKSTSTDEYLQNMADEKERLNKQFVKLIQNR